MESFGEGPARSDSQPARRRGVSVRALVQIVIGLGALGLVVMKADPRGLLEAIRSTRIAYLPFALLATLTVTWLMAYRWGIILRVRSRGVPTTRLFVYYLIGIFFMNFVPGGGVSGDVARLIYADREVCDKPFVLSTLIYERIVGLFTLLLIGFIATIASRSALPAGRTFYIGEAVLAVAFFVSSSLMSEYLSSKLAKLAKWAARRLRVERLGLAAARVLEAISDLRRHKMMLLWTVLLSLLIRIVWGLSWYVIAQAMGLPLGLPLIFTFVSLVDLIRMLPISVGGLGVREWAIVALFANVGIAREQALMFSFLAFAPIAFNAIAGGIIYVSRAGYQRKLQMSGERI